MASIKTDQMPTAGLSEEQFYAAYSWCLNPVLSLSDLFRRLGEELDRYDGLQWEWQREESRINLYLFVCAIACTLDDYLAWRPWNLAGITVDFPRLRLAITSTEWLLNLPHTLLGLFADRKIVQWRQEWDRCVDHTCEMLASESDLGAQEWNRFRESLKSLTMAKLPARVLKRRMQLPQGFRDHDLTHYDVLALARRFAATCPDCKQSLVIIGPRTAGAYFAPLIKASLALQGWSSVFWMTVRPRTGVSRREQRRLRALLSRCLQVILVDDHPNTGQTFRLLFRILISCGVGPHRMTILVPRHRFRPEWTLPEAEQQGARILTLDPAEQHKVGLLASPWLRSFLRECYESYNCKDVESQESNQLKKINEGLWERYRDGFLVRLKRVFEIRLGTSGRAVVKRVFVKSVGWGWLGYHAYICGNRLTGYVPKVIGLRNGFLFLEWLESAVQASADKGKAHLLKTISSYVARRVQRLRLTQDPGRESPGYRWTGWEEMVRMTRGLYGPYVGRLKTPVLRRHLGRYVSPVPTAIDGQMGPAEWIRTNTGIYKVDFEHHTFGRAALDIVDPAYDLATVIFEFGLSEELEHELLEGYVRETGDRTILGRLFLYKLFCGVSAMRNAAQKPIRETSRQEQVDSNLRYLRARNFLIYEMNRFLGSRLRNSPAPKWFPRLFFLDLDGVFDVELLGFPHTTPSGLLSFALLQANEVSIVLNTGRSVTHVWNYCKNYGLPGGLAEFGSVFVDAVRRQELPLIDAEAAEQLIRCREAINKTSGVFLDPDYRYSIRAYRYQGRATSGLAVAEVEALLTGCRCGRLTFIQRAADTYIVQKDTGKGLGLLTVKDYLGCRNEPVATVGDSDQDLEMLMVADIAYAPANCSQRLRELAARGRCRIVAQPFQRGLLAAVRELLRKWATTRVATQLHSIPSWDSDDLIVKLLGVAERSRWRQWLASLNWSGL